MQKNEIQHPGPDLALQPGTMDLPSRTILLVDDDSDIRSLIRTFLEHEGYRVLTCGNAERATQIFESIAANGGKIDLLVTDFYMPQESGMELAARLKQQTQDLPILIISGGILSDTYHQQLRLEGWNFLSKPFSLPDLLATVHVILQASLSTSCPAD